MEWKRCLNKIGKMQQALDCPDCHNKHHTYWDERYEDECVSQRITDGNIVVKGHGQENARCCALQSMRGHRTKAKPEDANILGAMSTQSPTSVTASNARKMSMG